MKLGTPFAVFTTPCLGPDESPGIAKGLDHRIRSSEQAGYRLSKSTVHHLFALRHSIDQARLAKRPMYTCFAYLQKAYDSVQHDLLRARLRNIGVGQLILAAFQPLYAGGALSMTVDGTAGPLAVQRVGGCQGWPLSLTLFGLSLLGCVI